MRRAGLLASLWLAAGMAQAEGQVSMGLPFAAGFDLSAAKREAWLASPELRVELSYEPALKIWGWTGRLGYCTGRRICIKKKWRNVVLPAEAIQRGPAGIRFSIPRRQWFGLMPYRPAGPLRVSLPTLWPGELPRHIDSDLKQLQARAPQQTVQDAHLSPPYVAVAAFGVGDGVVDSSSPYAIPACDPALQASAETGVALRDHRQAEAQLEWLQSLAESDWWAQQLSAVQRERGSESVSLNGQAVAADITRVSVSHEGSRWQYVQLQLPVLLGRTCAGSTQLRFSWRDAELLSASLRRQPDIFAEDCTLPVQTEEALWWQGELQRYARSDDPLQPLQQWERWRHGGGECGVSQTEPDVAALREAAARWF